MRFVYLALVASVCFLSVSAEAANICKSLEKATAQGSATLKFKRYLEAQWNHDLIEHPEFATYMGHPGQNDRWTDMSMQAIQRREKELDCELAIFKKIPRKGLSENERVSYDLYLQGLEMAIEGRKFPEEVLVLDHLGGLHTSVTDMMEAMPTATKKDYEDRIARLDKVPELEEQIETLLKEGLKIKVTPVKMFLTRVPAQFDRVLTEKVEDSPLFEPFTDIRADITVEQKLELKKKALEVIQAKAYPALKKLKAFVVTQYIPGARESIAMTDLPDGVAWYNYMSRMHTTTKMTSDELHNLGLKEVARLTNDMEAVKSQVKFKGSLQDFNKFLLTDDQFFYKDKVELLKGYRDIAKRVDPELTKLFKTLPRLPYGVKEMPEYKAKEAPTAYYEGGSLKSGRAGYFIANTYDLKARPKWGMEALTLHEAAPGHHLQIAVGQELPEMPEFRKNAGYTAFSEGWALYAESLGAEMGFYKDPYSRYGQLTYEIWRAVRLVVDTGIHTKGWSRQKAIDYFINAMPKSQLEAEVEVDRYITWPGQALAYKVGQLKFSELRNKSRTALGEKFDVREFHDQVLRNGALPMDVLEKLTNEWLEKLLKTKKK
ncbi:DUF885 domain-containing protein [Bdellovibrio sp. HCB337]|uniref:DUF885 domain-containing protein n=1 Tax=Bdellovibrio sp. HCB337 TaxID=3394358 RepID=UPI0039A6DE7D